MKKKFLVVKYALNSPRVEVQTGKRLIVTAAALLVATSIVALFTLNPFDWFSGSDPRAQAAEILERAQDAPVVRGAPGQVEHIITKFYFRYGPKAAEIMSDPAVGPETTISEAWALIGPDGRATNSYAVTRDASGAIVFETFNKPSYSEVRNARGETVFSTEFPEDFASRDVAPSNKTRYQGLIDQKIARLVGQSEVNGHKTYIIEWETSDIPTGMSSGTGLPYVADLAPVKLLSRVEFTQDSYAPLRSEVYVIDRTGTQHLVQSMEVLAWEFRTVDAVPPDVISALTG